MKPTSTSADTDRATAKPVTPWVTDVWALAAYALLACVFFWPLLRSLQSHILSYDNVDMPDACDSYEFLWRYWWMLAIVRHRVHPLEADWISPPTGDHFLFHSHPWVSEVLTLPLGLIFGPVVGYNLMIVLMLVFGAWVYYLMLRRGLGFHAAVSWFTGAGFGFSAYFVLRAHWHVTMIGACFWAAALGILVASYCRDRLTIARGLAFAVFFWATFWNSFVEVFMLAIAVAITAAVCELARIATRQWTWRSSLAFYIPVAVGGVSLLVLRDGPHASTIHMPLVDTAGVADFLRFPRLSLLSALTTPERPANWGISLPYSLMAMALVGVAVGVRRRPAMAVPLLVALVAMLVIAADPGHLASDWIRRLPLGQGFRIFTRFTPFALFFLGIFAATGADWLWRRWALTRRLDTAGWRGAVIAGLATLLLIEIYPAGLHLRPLRILDVPETVQQELRSGGYTLVVPEGPSYIQPHNVYQVALDAPCVLLTYWDKMNKDAKHLRETTFPHVYPPAINYPRRPLVDAPEILQELDALDVRYVLFADKRHLEDSVVRGDVMVETSREILIRLGPETQGE